MNNDNQQVKKDFFVNECRELTERNEQAVQKRSADVDDRGDGRRHVVLACMDERCTNTEEALGLQSSAVRRIATGGGKISPEDFMSLLGLTAGPLAGKGDTLYLSTHEVIGRPELGCAAFKNDIAAQERFFLDLKAKLTPSLPEAFIHVLSMDTSTSELRVISPDERDTRFTDLVARGGQPHPRLADEAHAGYGIYVGEAYRAWSAARNAYFHISASAPSLAGDLDIAIGVILHHSTVDLSDKTIVLQIDEPTSWNGFPAGAAERLSSTIESFLAKPDVAELLANGTIRIVRTTTDLDTHEGKVIQSEKLVEMA
ncbi:MAG: hypothetical protein V1738_06615 [Patescibacteria group bacterium]